MHVADAGVREPWRRRTGVAIRWQARSLEAFGDQPLEDVAGDYDLIVIDHPFCGRAERTALPDAARRPARRRGTRRP